MFEKYGACDVADALVAAGIGHGGSIPFVNKVSGPTKTISGPVYTVEYAPMDDPRPAVSDHYIDSVPDGAVILIATSPDVQLPSFPFTKITTSLYGGLMSTRAQYLGAKGTVVLGSVRDVAEHKALDYPVYSYSVGTCAPNKLAKVVGVNEALDVPDHIVHPGDFIVADENGVVLVPQSLAQRCLDYIPHRVKADTLAAEDIKQGVPAKTAQTEHRKNLPKF